MARIHGINYQRDQISAVEVPLVFPGCSTISREPQVLPCQCIERMACRIANKARWRSRNGQVSQLCHLCAPCIPAIYSLVSSAEDKTGRRIGGCYAIYIAFYSSDAVPVTSIISTLVEPLITAE